MAGRAPGTSRRVSKGRSRTGCLTCKIRRVKCDERKPACMRCTSTGRSCDGYPDSQRSTRSEVNSPGSLIQTTQRAFGIQHVSQPDEGLGETESRALEFFQIHTKNCFGPQIGSFLLQAVYHEPIIRTVAIAIGSLHRTFLYDREDMSVSYEIPRFTLVQYQKAIRQLVALDPQPSPCTNDTFLVACILFFCFECLQCRYQSAFRHAISGLKIIQQQKLLTGPTMSRYMPPETIALLFNILESQILEIQRDELKRSELRPALFSSCRDHVIGPPLEQSSSVEEMVSSFQVLYNRFTRFEAAWELFEGNDRHRGSEYNIQAQYIQTEISKVLAEFGTWAAVFDRWLDQPRTLNEHDSLSVCILKVWRSTTEIFLQLEWPPSELIWDKFTVQFASITSLVAEIFGITSMDGIMRSTSPVTASSGALPPMPSSRSTFFPPLYPKPLKSNSSRFSLSLGIVTPLYLCATRCRESSTRRQAVFLLSFSRRREGLWDSELAGRIANRIVSLEETAANIPPGTEYRPSQIPLSARITSLSPRFDDQRQIKIRYYGADDRTSPMEETLTW